MPGPDDDVWDDIGADALALEKLLAAEMVKLLSRQEAVVLARLSSPKVRRGTRHWKADPSAPTTTGLAASGSVVAAGAGGTVGGAMIGGAATTALVFIPPAIEASMIARQARRALDVSYILNAARWAAEARTKIEPLIAKIVQAAQDRLAQRTGIIIERPTTVMEADRLIEPFVQRAIDILEGKNRHVQELIAQAEADGRSTIEQIATSVREAYAKKQAWADQAASNAAVGAFNNGMLDQAKRQPSIVQAAWVSRRDSKVRYTHQVADGQVRNIGEPFNVGGARLDYPGDPTGPLSEVAGCRCLPAEQVVTASGVELGFKRWYVGDMVMMRTRSGRVFTATPNHPVLTSLGWLPLEALVPGDNLVCGGLSERMRLRDPDVDHRPAKIGEIVHALQVAQSPVRMPGSGMDFHGDGRAADVEVVLADSLLADALHAALGEPVDHEQFTLTDEAATALAFEGTSDLSLFNPGHPLVGSAVGDHGPVGLDDPAWLNACLEQARSNRGASDTVGDGESVLGLTGQVALDQFVERDVVPGMVAGAAGATRPRLESGHGMQALMDRPRADAEADSDLSHALPSGVSLDEVVGVERLRGWSGHVYNLQVQDGWYILGGSGQGGVLSRNCTMIFRVKSRKPAQVFINADRGDDMAQELEVEGVKAFNPAEARDSWGRWTASGSGMLDEAGARNLWHQTMTGAAPSDAPAARSLNGVLNPWSDYGVTEVAAPRLKAAVAQDLSERLSAISTPELLAAALLPPPSGATGYGSVGERGVREAAVSTLIAQWATTSNDSDPRSLALQDAAKKEFDLKDSVGWTAQDQKAHDEAVKLLAKHEATYRAFIRAQYDATQADLKARGVTHVQLWRGFAPQADKHGNPIANPDFPMPRYTGVPEARDVVMRPMSSWTTDPYIAYSQFGEGGTTFYAEVPVESVLSTPRTGFGALKESEVVVLGRPLAAVLVESEVVADKADNYPAAFMQAALRAAFKAIPQDAINLDDSDEHADWIKPHWLYRNKAGTSGTKSDAWMTELRDRHGLWMGGTEAEAAAYMRTWGMGGGIAGARARHQSFIQRIEAEKVRKAAMAEHLANMGPVPPWEPEPGSSGTMTEADANVWAKDSALPGNYTHVAPNSMPAIEGLRTGTASNFGTGVYVAKEGGNAWGGDGFRVRVNVKHPLTIDTWEADDALDHVLNATGLSKRYREEYYPKAKADRAAGKPIEDGLNWVLRQSGHDALVYKDRFDRQAVMVPDPRNVRVITGVTTPGVKAFDPRELRDPHTGEWIKVGDVVASWNGEPLAWVSGVHAGVAFTRHRDDLHQLDDAQREQIATTINEVHDRLPAMVRPKVDITNGESFASAGGWPSPSISIGSIWNDNARLATYSKDWSDGMGVAGGQASPEATKRAVLVHEAGHNIHRQIEHLSPAAKAEITALIEEPVVNRDLGLTLIPAQADDVHPRWQQDALISFDENGKRHFGSFYATENQREWFAEAIADGFLNGESASPSGKRALAIAIKYLGSVDGAGQGAAGTGGQGTQTARRRGGVKAFNPAELRDRRGRWTRGNADERNAQPRTRVSAVALPLTDTLPSGTQVVRTTRQSGEWMTHHPMTKGSAQRRLQVTNGLPADMATEISSGHDVYAVHGVTVAVQHGTDQVTADEAVHEIGLLQKANPLPDKGTLVMISSEPFAAFGFETSTTGGFHAPDARLLAISPDPTAQANWESMTTQLNPSAENGSQAHFMPAAGDVWPPVRWFVAHEWGHATGTTWTDGKANPSAQGVSAKAMEEALAAAQITGQAETHQWLRAHLSQYAATGQGEAYAEMFAENWFGNPTDNPIVAILARNERWKTARVKVGV